MQLDEQGIKREQLFEVWAERTDTGQLVQVPFFPRIGHEAAEEFASLMRKMIAEGKEKRFSNPQLVPHLGKLN